MSMEEPLDLVLNQISEDEPDFSESDYGQIQARFRHIQAITERAEQRRRQISPSVQSPVHMVSEQKVAETNTGVKKICACLVAEALVLAEAEPKPKPEPKNLFECNICLKMARDPVVTCCGHIFCWPCFYILPCHPYSNAGERECPVCDGEVPEEKLVPIYGQSSSGERDLQLELEEAGLKFPPRPAAQREERVNRGHQALSEALMAEIFESIFEDFPPIDDPVLRARPRWEIMIVRV